MNILFAITALALAVGYGPLSSAAQTLSQKRDVLQPEITITTLHITDIEKLPVTKAVEHESEVSRSAGITIVISILRCEPDARGVCNASADVVAYAPDGSVHDEIKDIKLHTRRGTARLNLTTGDATGVYKVVATIRDLNARRFAKTERLFGVK